MLDLSRFDLEIRSKLNATNLYLGIHLSSQQEVTVAYFDAAQTDWERFFKRENEMEILNALNHYSIPQSIATLKMETQTCFVREYRSGSSLSCYRNWSEEELKSLAFNILKTLSYLHSLPRPVIHGDILPEHVILHHRTVSLVGFGEARYASEELDSPVGFPGFTPPEQLLGVFTPSSDLYGLGATLLCLSANIPPLDLSSTLQNSGYPVRFLLRGRYSLGWIEWLEGMLQPDHNERTPNSRIALEQLLNDSASGDRALKTVQPTPIDISVLPSTRIVVSAAGGALLTAITSTVGNTLLLIVQSNSSPITEAELIFQPLLNLLLYSLAIAFGMTSAKLIYKLFNRQTKKQALQALIYTSLTTIILSFGLVLIYT